MLRNTKKFGFFGGLGVVGVIDQVTLGFIVLGILLNLVCFFIFFGYFSQIQQEISAASTNFQLSNNSIAEAIISLGELLDDLDEVSGDLVRPPQIGDVVAQGLQMMLFSKMQTMLPPEMTNMFNNQRFSEAESWQNESQKEVQDGNTKVHLN